MEEEIASNNTWILVKRPPNKKLIACKRIYKLKKEVPETPRYKARLVGEGFTQKEIIDFNNVFSLVVKHILINVLLAITTFSDLELNQIDVKTAFLHENLNEEILMTQLKGFIEEGTKDTVCLLKKSFYRLKQSPRQ